MKYRSKFLEGEARPRGVCVGIGAGRSDIRLLECSMVTTLAFKDFGGRL